MTRLARQRYDNFVTLRFYSLENIRSYIYNKRRFIQSFCNGNLIPMREKKR